MSNIAFNPTTPMWFYKLTSAYVPGVGQTDTWTLVSADALYGEWKGGFGSVAVQAATIGVNGFATIRTFYHPAIHAAMQTQRIVVVKNSTTDALKDGIPNVNNPNVYELWGAVDNINLENRLMEFRVRRFEGI